MNYEELDKLVGQKEYQFEFNGTVSGYGIVTAQSEEEAKKKVQNGEYDDIIDTWGMEIAEVTSIEED